MRNVAYFWLWMGSVGMQRASEQRRLRLTSSPPDCPAALVQATSAYRRHSRLPARRSSRPHLATLSGPEWHASPHVVLIEEDQVTVGHVGDSRLYLLTPGKIEKITRDHSPVGELEDSQSLSEDAAMRHPRRNEVYRDLGSAAHTPNDADFVEIHSFALPQPAALLLCSDGLTDQVTAADIRHLVEHHAGDPEKAARALVEAANEAGGKDNVTVILVETEDYAGVSAAAEPGQGFSRHSSRWTWFLLGLLAASAVFLAARPYWEHSTSGLKLRFGVVSSPRSWTVGPDAIPTIGAALDRARAWRYH